jgi:putative GTP pyrophosphokinase
MEIQLWREILDPYALAVDELVIKFNYIIDEYRHVGAYSPIEQVTGRVKTISSILEKALKKNIDLKNFEEKIEDIAGIRIICQFVEDIYKVVDIIKKRSDMRVKSEKDWATIEHSLQYKYKQNIPEHIRERLSSAAEAVIILDREMSVVRDEIMDAQNSFTIKANIVADILTNIQNLYKVANKQEVIKIQDDFFRIYQNGDQDELEKFSEDLDRVAQRYRAQSLR